MLEFHLNGHTDTSLMSDAIGVKYKPETCLIKTQKGGCFDFGRRGIASCPSGVLFKLAPEVTV